MYMYVCHGLRERWHREHTNLFCRLMEVAGDLAHSWGRQVGEVSRWVLGSVVLQRSSFTSYVNLSSFQHCTSHTCVKLSWTACSHDTTGARLSEILAALPPSLPPGTRGTGFFLRYMVGSHGCQNVPTVFSMLHTVQGSTECPVKGQKRKLLLHGTLKMVYQIYHSKQEKQTRKSIFSTQSLHFLYCPWTVLFPEIPEIPPKTLSRETFLVLRRLDRYGAHKRHQDQHYLHKPHADPAHWFIRMGINVCSNHDPSRGGTCGSQPRQHMPWWCYHQSTLCSWPLPHMQCSWIYRSSKRYKDSSRLQARNCVLGLGRLWSTRSPWNRARYYVGMRGETRLRYKPTAACSMLGVKYVWTNWSAPTYF